MRLVRHCYRQPRIRLYSTASSSAGTQRPRLGRGRRRRSTVLALVAVSTTITGVILFAPTTTTAPARLNTQTFAPFRLTGKTGLPCGTSAVLALQGATGPSWPDIWAAGRLYSVHVAREEMGVWRKYTPVPLGAGGQMQLLVAAAPAGCVSPHLHGLPLGSRVLVRGPFVEFDIPPSLHEVVCLVGGTGVACAVQAVGPLLERGVRTTIVWAVRSHGRGQNPVLAHLHHLQSVYPATLTISTHTDHTPSALKPSFLLSLLLSQPQSQSRPPNPATAKKLLLVAGPPGFVEHWVGAKVWDNSVGEEGQGSLGGVLGEELIKRKGEWMVWKL
ncbi:MAG: mitochondrial peripheral inner membrane protein [Geoglossum simile]|nr:MAG: mitochondrial peripheral inner membrane protein [Geoglossum simile]